ncbi:MAG: GNAT family N-acetyltransferase [Lachnospiraceae bacterium]|nr:GNAT family N-acetyltransferase [Lachnospiraceae bacterium]
MRYLRTVVYDDPLLKADHFMELLEELKSENVECISGSQYIQSVSSETLFICDNPYTCKQARANDTAFITYMTDARGSMCIVEGFEEITADFCEKMLMRKLEKPWIIARTERLMIREFRPDDELGVFKDKWGDRSFIDRYIDCQYHLFGYGIWALEKKDDGKIIGKAGLFNSPRHEGLELGYEVIEGYRRQGYAFEAVKAISKYASEELEAERIFITISPDNIASIGLAEKLKMTENVDIIISLEYTVDRK